MKEIKITGSLQIKKEIYFAVFSYKKDGKWTNKWLSTKVKAVRGNKRKAEIEFDNLKIKFQEELNSDSLNADEDMLFIDFMKQWLKIIKSSVEQTTYMGYRKLINGRMSIYFQDKDITVNNIKPRDIQEFYQYLLNKGLSRKYCN